MSAHFGRTPSGLSTRLSSMSRLPRLRLENKTTSKFADVLSYCSSSNVSPTELFIGSFGPACWGWESVPHSANARRRVRKKGPHSQAELFAVSPLTICAASLHTSCTAIPWRKNKIGPNFPNLPFPSRKEIPFGNSHESCVFFLRKFPASFSFLIGAKLF